jgi:hypothetical protein
MSDAGLAHLDYTPPANQRTDLNEQALNKQNFCILNDEFFAYSKAKKEKADMEADEAFMEEEENERIRQEKLQVQLQKKRAREEKNAQKVAAAAAAAAAAAEVAAEAMMDDGAVVAEQEGIAQPPKKARTIRCSNPLCRSTVLGTVAVARRDYDWKSCGAKNCNLIYCIDQSCQELRTQHMNIVHGVIG